MAHFIHSEVSGDIQKACIGCTQCLDKCPTEAIVGERQALHVILSDLCIDCGVCGNVCPVACITDQFDRVVPKKKMVDRPRPVINKDNCTGCEYCIDYCPENVLELRRMGKHEPATQLAGRVSHLVGEKTCIGCALCAEICPHDAIHMTDAAECKELIAAGELSQFYVRNVGELVEA